MCLLPPRGVTWEEVTNISDRCVCTFLLKKAIPVYVHIYIYIIALIHVYVSTRTHAIHVYACTCSIVLKTCITLLTDYMYL